MLADALNVLQHVLAVLVSIDAEKFKALADGEDGKIDSALFLALDGILDDLLGCAVVGVHLSGLPVDQRQVAASEEEAIDLVKHRIEHRVVLICVREVADVHRHRAMQLDEFLVDVEDILIKGITVGLHVPRLREDADPWGIFARPRP